MRPLRGVTRPLALLVAVALVATACGSDSSPTDTGITPQEVQGDWSLVSFTLEGNTLVPPTVSGELHLTLTNYKLHLVLPPPNGEQTDSGTYTISGNTWSQTSTNGGTQAQGTVSLSGDHNTLTVALTVDAQHLAMVLSRDQ